MLNGETLTFTSDSSVLKKVVISQLDSNKVSVSSSNVEFQISAATFIALQEDIDEAYLQLKVLSDSTFNKVE